MPLNTLSQWKENSQFGIGDYVYSTGFADYMFKCIDLMKSTGSTAPDLTLLSKGDFITDGSIVWVIRDYSSEAPAWASYSNVRLGESRNVPTSNATYSLECVSYTGTVGTEENLEFEQTEYPILSTTSDSFVISGDKTSYFRIGDVIHAVHPEGVTAFEVTNCVYVLTEDKTTIVVRQTVDTSLGYTEIYAQERGTRDGQILWKLVDNIDSVTYDWNVYTTFDYDLDIIGN